MKITWLGHSALKIEGSRIVFIDPFLTGNPRRRAGRKSTGPTSSSSAMITATTWATVSPSARKPGPRWWPCMRSPSDSGQGIRSEPMGIGGTVNVAGVDVSLVPAFHSAGLGGTAAGVVVHGRQDRLPRRRHGADPGDAVDRGDVLPRHRLPAHRRALQHDPAPGRQGGRAAPGSPSRAHPLRYLPPHPFLAGGIQEAGRAASEVLILQPGGSIEI